MSDALIRAGRATYVLIALGDNWTRYVSYHTPQSVSAADGAAALVMGFGLALWAYGREREARTVSETERSAAEAARSATRPTPAATRGDDPAAPRPPAPTR